MLTVCLRSSDLGTPGLRRITLGVCYYGFTPDMECDSMVDCDGPLWGDVRRTLEAVGWK